MTDNITIEVQSSSWTVDVAGALAAIDVITAPIVIETSAFDAAAVEVFTGGLPGAKGDTGPAGPTGAPGPPGTGSVSGMTAGQIPIAATATGITSSANLSGDIVSAPTTLVTTLATVNSNVGTFARATITVNAKGLVTAASAGATDAGITQLTGDGTAGPGNGSQALALATVNANVGSFQGLTVNAKGLVTAAVNQNYLTTTTASATYAPIASPVFTGDPQAPTPATADNDTSIATTAFVKAQGYATTATVTAGDNLRVLKAGDTMTGQLIVNAPIVIDRAAGTDRCFLGQTGGLTRWFLDLGDTTAETGSNAGSNFQLSRWNDAGGLLGTVISADRASGTVTFSSAPVIPGYLTTATATATYAPINAPVFTGDARAVTPATADNDTSIATTAYVQAQGYATSTSVTTAVGLRVLKAGDSMTGQLNINNQVVALVLNNATDSFMRFIGNRTWTVGNDGGGQNFWVFDGTASAIRLQITSAGACSNATGTWTAISDGALKEAVEPYTRGLDAITQLNPVMFRYQAGTPFGYEDRPSDLRLGLIAEEVAPHVPEIVGEMAVQVRGAPQKVGTLDNGNLIFALINTCKELAARVEALEAQSAAGPAGN